MSDITTFNEGIPYGAYMAGGRRGQDGCTYGAAGDIPSRLIDLSDEDLQRELKRRETFRKNNSGKPLPLEQVVEMTLKTCNMLMLDYNLDGLRFQESRNIIMHGLLQYLTFDGFTIPPGIRAHIRWNDYPLGNVKLPVPPTTG